MNKRLTAGFIVLVLSMMLLCTREKPVAIAGNKKIFMSDLQEFIEKQPRDSSDVLTNEDYEVWINKMIEENVLLYLASQRYDDFESNTTSDTLQSAKGKMLIDLRQKASQEISKSKCNKHYFDNKSRYIEKMKTQVDIVNVKKYDIAKHIASAAKNGTDFVKLKSQYHRPDLSNFQDPSDQFIDEDEYGEIGKIASQMEVDEISDPVEITRSPVSSYVVIKTIDRLPERQKSFDEMYFVIADELVQVLMDSIKTKWIEDMKQSIPIRIYQDRLL